MPEVNIMRLGEVEYTQIPLRTGIKGITKVGKLDFPILIDEKIPGASLQWVVAHEAGHRLTLEMIFEAIKSDPKFFKPAKNIYAGLIQFWIAQGLDVNSITINHPGVKHALTSGDFLKDIETNEELAREFISEVFAGWATGESNIPPAIASVFEGFVTAKREGTLPALSRVRERKEEKEPTLAESSTMPGWYDPWAKFAKGEP